MTPFDKLIVGNAGGMTKTLTDVERFCKSAVTRITVGSVTKLERIGNTPVPPGDVYYFDEETYESGNSLGLNNMGMRKYMDVLPQMVKMAHAAGKELRASVNSESIGEILELVQACFACGVDGVEINLACPNVHDKGKQKPLMCQDMEAVEELLLTLKGAGVTKNLGIKIAPTNDEGLLVNLCSVMIFSRVVTEVVATNTIGGQRFVRDGIDKIAFRPPGSDDVKHIAGLAGRPLHKPAVWVHRVLRYYLPAEIDTIGVGGIFEGADAHDFLKDGAAGFQCATAVMKFGPSIFEAVLGQLADYY